MTHGQGKGKGKEGMHWYLVHPMAPEALGYIPNFLSVADPRPAKEQFNERYVFGGWKPFGTGKWKMNDKFELLYPGDPPTVPVAWTMLRDERIVVYVHEWVAIIQPDGSFEVCRMD